MARAWLAGIALASLLSEPGHAKALGLASGMMPEADPRGSLRGMELRSPPQPSLEQAG